MEKTTMVSWKPIFIFIVGVFTVANLIAFSTAFAQQLKSHIFIVQAEAPQPFAIWQFQGRFAVIDRAGSVITKDNVGQFGRLPFVVGAGADQHAAALIDLLRGYPAIVERVYALVRVGDRRWNLRLLNGTDVLLPEGDEATSLRRLAELQGSYASLDRHDLDAVDLRDPARNVLRLKSEKDAKPPTGKSPNSLPQKQVDVAEASRAKPSVDGVDAAGQVQSSNPHTPPPPAPRQTAPCAQLDDKGRSRCLLPVWYVMNDRGCERVDTVIGDERSRIRTPLDFKYSARREGTDVTLRNLPGPGQMVEATAVGSSAMLVFAPNFLSCSINFNVRIREAAGLKPLDLLPQPPPPWVAALGGD